MIENNIMLNTDSYKATHWLQYPPGTENIYSYLESRGGKYPATVFFGLQYLIKKHLMGQVVTQKKIDEAEVFWDMHFGRKGLFNREGWEYILNKHDGYLPIEIRAIPEGSVIPLKNALLTIENTDKEVPWLTNWIETLLVQVWYSITVCTNSYFIKQEMLKYAEITGCPIENVPFKLHDFGFRGVSCYEEAMIGAMSHLVNFMGTDTTAGIVGAMNYYNAGMCGFSLPASEHSTITSWGKNKELDAFKNMLDKYPNGLVACVSDSYDIFYACEHLWGEKLKEQILNRDGCLIVRPDSGDPVEVVLKVLLILWKRFGGTTNAKGYKVLDPHIRIIQGDGVDYEMIILILKAMENAKFCTDNCAFGSGGGLLRKHDRDTLKFACKCSYIIINGEGFPVWKEPVTSYMKHSKRGRLKVVRDVTIHTCLEEEYPKKENMLRTVFLNGKLLIEEDFETIRKRTYMI